MSLERGNSEIFLDYINQIIGFHTQIVHKNAQFQRKKKAWFVPRGPRETADEDEEFWGTHMFVPLCVASKTLKMTASKICIYSFLTLNMW